MSYRYPIILAEIKSLQKVQYTYNSQYFKTSLPPFLVKIKNKVPQTLSKEQWENQTIARMEVELNQVRILKGLTNIYAFSFLDFEFICGIAE